MELGEGTQNNMMEDRRVVARRLFDALCAQYPDKYIALDSTTRCGGRPTRPHGPERLRGLGSLSMETPMAPRGVYRERNEWGNGQNSVVVNYGTSHFDVTEDKTARMAIGRHLRNCLGNPSR